MLFFVATGYSESGESEAVSNALGVAAGMGEEAESIHVMVLGVVKTGAGWQATVKIVVEPKMELKKGKDAEEEDDVCLELDRKAEDDRKARIHLYAHVRMDLFDAVHRLTMLGYSGIYTHYIEEGPLWNEVLNYYPDVDFYEVTHPEGVKAYKTDHPDVRRDLEKLTLNLKTAHLEKEPA